MPQSFQLDIITKTIKDLKQLVELDVKSNWYCLDEDLPNPPQISDLENWQSAQVNDKHYLVWEKGRKIKWFAQKIIIPHHLNNYPVEGLSLRLLLTWWSEKVEIFVNGKLVQEGDLFDSSTRLLLTSHCIPNQEILVCLRLISPNHDIGALMRSILLYENLSVQDTEMQSSFGEVPFSQDNFARKDAKTQRRTPRVLGEDQCSSDLAIDAGLVADELTILSNYLAHFAPERLDLLVSAIELIDWDNVHNFSLFNLSLANLRSQLLPLSDFIKQRRFFLVGHAHLDLAWLWEVQETYEVAQRTFNSVLSLQQDYPYLTFGHTTACLYQWIEENQPDLFSCIQNSVSLGKWEILGGMWVEPEVNLISGESLIRQLLYGQSYFKAKFGHYNRVAWLPDSFGFSWQLPQILRLAEIDYFVTGKLHWNDTTKFPFPCFWWQSPDGSKIFTLMSPPNVTGVMDTNPITMTNYAIDWEMQTQVKDIFWIPGVGDHGGGPTHDMIEVANKYAHSPFFPQLQFTLPSTYLDRLSHYPSSRFPTWNDELFLEFHRGCYTTHADQKFFNRYAENLLYQTELFSTIAILLSQKSIFRTASSPIISNNNINNEFCQANQAQIRQKIASLWKQVLFNQFHDILPGTSIPEVFLDANQNWEDVISNNQEILESALRVISSYISLTNSPHPLAKSLIIFNPLNWERSEIIEIPLTDTFYLVYNDQGKEVISQNTESKTLLFRVDNIPSIGYQVFWLVPQELPLNQSFIENQSFVLENDYLRVTIDSQTGDLASVFDKINQREVLSGAGNQLQLFQDQGQYWDAWNIDPNYQQYPLESPTLTSIQWLDKGALQLRVRVTKKFNQSEFIQDYILQSHSPLLTIKNTVNWKESHILLKVAFPLTINSDFATYEIACGAITRTTKPQTEADQAKWEVYAHNWADLSTENYGVSLLNNCKYGYDSTPNQLRLTLLRSSTWPDANADQGLHHFTYALYPHSGDWKSAHTVKKGYELNLPLQPISIDSVNLNSNSLLPSQGKLLDLGADNLILMALKPSENDDNTVILRCYEFHGENADLALENDLNLTTKERINCLENSLNYTDDLHNIKPWQIATFSLSQNT
jgi:alpha-mannosidase